MIAKREKTLLRQVNQSSRAAPKYMCGYEVPRKYLRAIELDTRNGNTKWKDSTNLEMGIPNFQNKGHSRNTKPHLIYAMKHDGRHKARCVADGHLTDIPIESVYSRVVLTLTSHHYFPC